MAAFQSVSVIGAGAWGTALAALAASKGIRTTIWAREPDVVAAINEARENRAYLPGETLPESLRATGALTDAGDAEAFVFVVPVQFARTVILDLRNAAPAAAPMAVCAKGLEARTGAFVSEIFGEVWPGARLSVLSGPSFARDVARGLPTAVTLASGDADLAERWAATIGAPHFRPYLSGDVIGAELGGAAKNVLAIAAGAVEGRGLGESARAALIARGYAELRRLGVALGARPETMGGLSGLGDLILTATSAQSRNMSLGMALGRGEKLSDVLRARNSVSEGVATAGAIVARAERAGVDTPICRAVADLVAGTRTIEDIAADLLARPIKQETA